MNNTVYFVYDGECPLCSIEASHYRMKETFGELEIVDARTQKDHPVMQEIQDARIDLDEGMVFKYNGQLYQGDEALHIMAKLGANKGLLNVFKNSMFKSKRVARTCYPSMRAVRNITLKLLGKKKIRNLENY